MYRLSRDEGKLPEGAVKCLNPYEDHLIKGVCSAESGSSCVFTGDSEGLLISWDIAAERILDAQPSESSVIWSVAMHPRGDRLVSGGDAGVISFWQPEPLILQGSREGHQGCVNSVSFRPGFDHVVSGGEDGRLRLWDAVTLSEVNLFLSEPTLSTVESALFVSENILVSGGRDGRVILRDLRSSESRMYLANKRENVLSLCTWQGGEKIFVGSEEGNLRLFDIRNQKGGELEAFSYEGSIHALEAIVEWGSMVVGGNDNHLHFLDVEKLEKIGALLIHEDCINDIEYRSDLGRMISVSDDKTIKISRLEDFFAKRICDEFERLGTANESGGESEMAKEGGSTFKEPATWPLREICSVVSQEVPSGSLPPLPGIAGVDPYRAIRTSRPSVDIRETDLEKSASKKGSGLNAN